MMVIQKSFFTHDVNIDVPFITALGVAYNHLGDMLKGVSRSCIQEQLLVFIVLRSGETCLCYLVDTRFFSPRIDHRKVNAVSPVTMSCQ